MQRGMPYWGEGIKVVCHVNQVNLLSQMCSSFCTDLTNLDIKSIISNSNTNNNDSNNDGKSNDSELPSPRRLGVHGG